MKSITIIIAALALAGCATGSKRVAPAEVPPKVYSSLSCAQMRAEAVKLSADAERLGTEQDKKAEKDAVLMATSLLIFAPAAIGISGNDETAANLSVVKGQAYALQAAAEAKGCA